jgi:hypothetical protein
VDANATVAGGIAVVLGMTITGERSATAGIL